LYQGKAENKNNLWYPMQPSHEKEKTSEQKEKLIDTLTGYHEPEYFRKLP
jgi:hypothetical protein